ncbi:MAG: carboxypeptidase regulatory-like domain-containing protein, partial [Vicinamibacterales bacterium]
TIRGRVEVAQAVGPADRRPGVTDLGVAPARGSVDRRRSVVYLETAPRGAFDDRPERGRTRMDQRDETFVPHVLAIVAGTTVEFPNNDRTYHNVFSLSKPRTFDLGRYAVGKSKAVRFDRPGIVRVFCDIHSHMNAFILVFGHPYFATTDADGRYRIPDVPAGSYTVAVWNEGVVRESRRVTVPDAADVEINFALGR